MKNALFTLIAILASLEGFSQDVSINITNLPTVKLNQTTPILVTLCNEDPNPVDAPPNRLRPQVSVPTNVTIVGVTETDGSPLTEWTLQSISTGNGNTAIVRFAGSLINGECKSFHVIVRGQVLSGNQLYTSTLGFNGPQTPGNNTLNDNSQSGIAVIAPGPPPVAVDDNSQANSTIPTTIKILLNDVAADSPLDPSSVQLINPLTGGPAQTVTIPGEGTYVVNPDGTITFSPVSGYTGTSTVKYTVKDQDGDESNQATITLTVSPLPVTLVSFKAVKEGSTAQLNWATTEETNSDRFEIQRSQDGKNWLAIGSVASNGESVARRDYNFTDESPATGSNYYRLKMVDKDDTYTYSRSQVVSFEGSLSIIVFPNPVSDVLFVRETARGATQSVSLVNTAGEIVYRAGTVPINGINVKELPNGMYIVKVTGEGGSLYTQKVVINK